MELEQTDQEQVEALQNWWRENWLSLVAGLVLGLGGILGWQYYGEYSTGQAMSASAAYEEMMDTLLGGDIDAAAQGFEALQQAHPKSPYVAQARLALAQAHADAGQWSEAEAQLQIVAGSDDPALSGLARLRLARSLWAQGKVDAALSALNMEQAGTYAGLYAELRGDINLAQGNTEAARSAWQEALNVQPGVVDRASVQRKLDRLP